MMRKDLGEVIAMAKERGFWVSVQLDLTLYDRHPERLAEADLVYTSLDGDEASHVAARGDGSTRASSPASGPRAHRQARDRDLRRDRAQPRHADALLQQPRRWASGCTSSRSASTPTSCAARFDSVSNDGTAPSG